MFFQPVRYTSGAHAEEADANGPFRWLTARSTLEFEASDHARFLDFWALSAFYDLSQEFTARISDRLTTFALPRGWSPVSVEVPVGAERVEFSSNKRIPAAHHPADPRELGAGVRGLSFHDDAERHRRIMERHHNAVANVRETLGGRTHLHTTPPSLGIDMYGACNVKPPCVYCEWDWNKSLEGPFVDAPFTLDTLREWGPFFDHSTNLVNCSIGEPFMMKNIDELLDAFAANGKFLELTTNGQILTETNIQKLLGRSIALYISLDSAAPDTYAKLRNQRFDAILNNVRRLVEAKGGPKRQPVVNLVFMPMKANLGELDRFVGICADLRVDRLVLRPLNYSDKLELNWDRAGYRFEYQKELLPFETLVRASGRAAELCRRAGVELSDQMDFGGSLGRQFDVWFEDGRRSVTGPPPTESPAEPVPARPTPIPAESRAPSEVRVQASLGSEANPACLEPWKSLYILRRGVFPCCYGAKPIAPMNEYREAWNSPLLQAIRGDLARGRFHQYCLDSPACPIVRKSAEAHELRPADAIRMRARHVGAEANRQWRKAIWARQWAGIRLRRILTEPAYVRQHLGRMWQRLGGGK